MNGLTDNLRPDNGWPLEENLSAALGMKVRINHKGAGAGQVTIDYTDLSQLDRLCETLSEEP